MNLLFIFSFIILKAGFTVKTLSRETDKRNTDSKTQKTKENKRKLKENYMKRHQPECQIYGDTTGSIGCGRKTLGKVFSLKRTPWEKYFLWKELVLVFLNGKELVKRSDHLPHSYSGPKSD